MGGNLMSGPRQFPVDFLTPLCACFTERVEGRCVSLERMAGRSVAVEAFKVQLWAASIAQFGRLRVGAQTGPVDLIS